MRGASVLCLGLVLAACRFERAPSGRPAGTRSAADSVVRMEEDSAAAEPVRAALRVYYDRLSRRNWAGVAQSFWRGAVVTTEWLPPGETSPRLDLAPVDEFVRRLREGPARQAVFEASPESMDVRAYGALAEAWVVVRQRLGTGRDSGQVRRGVDAFHLARHEGTWRIASLVFTVEDPDRPLAAPAPGPRAGSVPGAAGAGAPGASRR